MILEIDNIELSYDAKYILNGIYIKGELGKVTGILGRNGCGKSSLLKITFGHISAQNKLIRIDKKPILKPLYTTGNVKYLPQTELLPKSMSIPRAFKAFQVDWNKFVKDFSGLEKYKNNKVKELSGGERRVVETYLMLMAPGDIVLLDEPFSNIAPVYVETIIRLIKEQKHHKIILLTDHMYRHIVSIADELYLIHNTSSNLIQKKEDLIRFGYLVSDS